MASITPRQSMKNLDGKDTTVLLQSFADRVLVLVTQIGKVGNLIQASLPATAPLSPFTADQTNQITLPEPSPAIKLTPLLGSASSEHLQTLHSLYAAQIATLIWTRESQLGLGDLRRSVIVGVALAKREKQEDGLTQAEKQVFDGVMGMVNELLQ